MKQIKLPKFIPTGRHPLLLLRVFAEAHGTSLRQIAITELNVTQQSLNKMMMAAQRSRHYLVPPHHVPKLSALLDVPPYYFDPVLWPDATWRFK